MMKQQKKYYLGIDLGTSAAKAIAQAPSGERVKARQCYRDSTVAAWFDAVGALIAEIRQDIDGEIAAIAISSQVGTYAVNGQEVISWQSSLGKEELDMLKATVSEQEFIEEIGMPHPSLISYPLPRLCAIQARYGTDAEVLMPKELLIRSLTDETVTDVFSMRGIANPQTGKYASKLIRRLGIEIALPPIKHPTALAGYVTERAAKEYGLPVRIPVYLGCNDFFAGLLGMGIDRTGDAFDLSGTSEHIGYISDGINPIGFVSGGYFTGCCTYGGTKASGVSCELAIKELGIDGLDLDSALSQKPPVFLPYLCGERAPIFDENARGVYFGLHDKTDRQALAYATLEGVVFSLYDIASSMEMPKPKRLICGGGSAKNQLMNVLRATLFDCETVCVCENDTSALGACMLAMVGDGIYPDISAAIAACVRYTPAVTPSQKHGAILKKRFAIYKELYGNLKSTFQKWNNIYQPKGDMK